MAKDLRTYLTNTFVDLVAMVPDRDEAIALGRKYNQVAIYDLAAGETIDTGGTGEWDAFSTPPAERLPKLQR